MSLSLCMHNYNYNAVLSHHTSSVNIPLCSKNMTGKRGKLCENNRFSTHSIPHDTVYSSTHHMSICVEYSVDPRRTSGGRYQSVTTSLEYVLVGTDLALAKPKSAS